MEYADILHQRLQEVLRWTAINPSLDSHLTHYPLLDRFLSIHFWPMWSLSRKIMQIAGKYSASFWHLLCGSSLHIQVSLETPQVKLKGRCRCLPPCLLNINLAKEKLKLVLSNARVFSLVSIKQPASS